MHYLFANVLKAYRVNSMLTTLKHAESIKGINMSDFKPQLKIVTMAVAVAISRSHDRLQ